MFDKKSRVHFIGIGGIGMSGLAQMLQEIGCTVSGSDRDSENPENQPLFNLLKQQGITIFPQDGSYLACGTPDVIVYSTAVEEDNPDFEVAPEVERIHRSTALEQALELYSAGITVAVSGSSGKTSVTAYLAEALNLVGAECGCLDGGMVRAFADPTHPGNFKSGREIFVFEADESDKSLLNYTVDYAIILNIGYDHYEAAELARIFGAFSKNVRRGIVLSRQVFEMISEDLPAGVPIKIVADSIGKVKPDGVDYYIDDYRVDSGRAACSLNGKYEFALPQPGIHTALNMSAVAAMLEMTGFDIGAVSETFGSIRGASRRFEFAGRLNAAPVYDDYAHNPQKLRCCLQTAQSLVHGKVIMVWQPHGYKPLGFMKDELFHELSETLRPRDVFLLLEPFYAGGSSSFFPHSHEVVESWCLPNVRAPRSREEVEIFLKEQLEKDDLLIICGARDNTLSIWASGLTKK